MMMINYRRFVSVETWTFKGCSLVLYSLGTLGILWRRQLSVISTRPNGAMNQSTLMRPVLPLVIKPRSEP